MAPWTATLQAMDPWGNVLPSVVTSLVTTLVTLGLAFGTRKWRARADIHNGPIWLKRGQGLNWVLVNRSKKYMSELSVHVATADGGYRDYPPTNGGTGYGPVLETTLYPRAEMWLPPLEVGETVSVNWAELRRNRPHRWRHVDVRIKADTEEYFPQASSSAYNRYGGGK